MEAEKCNFPHPQNVGLDSRILQACNFQYLTSAIAGPCFAEVTFDLCY